MIKPRWKLFAQGLMLLSLIRLMEWAPALSTALGEQSNIVPLWQVYDTWFEPSAWWLNDFFAQTMLLAYVLLLANQLLRPSLWGLLLVGVIQFQLHLVLYFFITTADNWRLVCLWYAIAGILMNQYGKGFWIKNTFMIHLLLFYWLTVWHKLMYVEWQDGRALQLVSWHPFWGADYPSFLASKFITYATMVVEVMMPIGLFFNSTRKWAVSTGVLFHAGIMIFIPVAGFSCIMIWSCLFILSELEWDCIKKALKFQRLHNRV